MQRCIIITPKVTRFTNTDHAVIAVYVHTVELQNSSDMWPYSCLVVARCGWSIVNNQLYALVFQMYWLGEKSEDLV